MTECSPKEGNDDIPSPKILVFCAGAPEIGGMNTSDWVSSALLPLLRGLLEAVFGAPHRSLESSWQCC